MTDTEEAVSRLTAWLRDFGQSSSKVFIGDLTIVLHAAQKSERLFAELEEARQEIERLKR